MNKVLVVGMIAYSMTFIALNCVLLENHYGKNMLASIGYNKKVMYLILLLIGITIFNTLVITF